MPANAKTDATGYYLIGAFPAGDYTIRCQPTPAQGYIPLYYSNSIFAAPRITSTCA